MNGSIDRQKAIATADIMLQKCDGDINDYHDLMVEALKVLPPAEPERETGRWIELTNTNIPNHTYVCSVCGRMLINITDGKNKVSKHYPFCHCGAKMEVEE